MKSIRKCASLWFVCALCILIVFVLVIINLPSSVFAAQEGVLTYTLNDAGTEATITGCDTTATNEDVAAAFDEICSPGGIRKHDIVTIEYQAFRSCNNLTEVELPGGLTSIGDSAFSNCYSLMSVTIPAGVISIGEGVFEHCDRLTEVELPGSLESIGDRAFVNCRLMSVTIPAGVISIGEGVFENCDRLTEVELPDGLTSIGGRAFSNCRYLMSITIPAGVINIGEGVFEHCDRLTEVELPDGLTSIGGRAFSNCRYLMSITIPAGVISIGEGVFESCDSLTEVELPGGLTSIGGRAFSNCRNLTSVTIPAGVISIGEGVFESCDSLTSVFVDEGNPVYSSEGGALSDGNQVIFYPPKSIQTSYIVPDGVTGIADNAFYRCEDLTEIELPAGLTSIGYDAFAYCSGLTSIDIPDSVTTIGITAFWNCTGLTSVSIPNGVASITHGMFLGCTGLMSAVIPNSVTSIEIRAFEDCTKLTEIELPNGLMSIGSRAFDNTRIKKISIPSSLTTVELHGEEGPFNNMSYLSEIVFEHGMESFPTGILSGSLSNSPNIYVPMSIASGADTAGFDLSSDFTINGIKGSYIIEWAKSKELQYGEVDGEIKDPDIERAWLNVPYQYIIETGTYENVGLNFNVVGGALPDGLELLPDGQFHGAPLETGTFTFVVEVRYPVFDYLLDIQSIVLTVEEPVGYPGDIELFESNDYPITDFVGESTDDVGGVPVGYVLTHVRDEIGDRIFRVADNDINDDGVIDADDSNFPYFTDFWLDGEKLTSASAISGGDYGASEGSTVVTVYAKTFQNLDNGNHTIAAEFMIPTKEGDPPVQKVAAQKFTLELSDPEPDQNTPMPGGNSGGGYMASAPAQPGTESTGPTVLPAPVDTDAADETPVAPVIAPEALITIAEDINAAGVDTSPAGTAGAAAIDGLPRDENGLFYFVLDGSGAPLEARIDMPLADFADMYFDGELWTPGEDYAVREGSTILVITAEKLADFAYGMHEISARFTEDRMVAFAFDLRGSSLADGTQAGSEISIENTTNDAGAPASSFPVVIFVMVMIGAALLIGALILRGKRV